MKRSESIRYSWIWPTFPARDDLPGGWHYVRVSNGHILGVADHDENGDLKPRVRNCWKWVDEETGDFVMASDWKS